MCLRVAGATLQRRPLRTPSPTLSDKYFGSGLHAKSRPWRRNASFLHRLDPPTEPHVNARQHTKYVSSSHVTTVSPRLARKLATRERFAQVYENVRTLRSIVFVEPVRLCSLETVVRILKERHPKMLPSREWMAIKEPLFYDLLRRRWRDFCHHQVASSTYLQSER